VLLPRRQRALHPRAGCKRLRRRDIP
jgi:hypothetical protein